MAKQELLDKIIADAEERARQILAEAEGKAASQVAAAEAERAALLDSARKMASAAAPETIRRRKAMAELEGRKLVLAEKQALIREAYQKALLAVKKSDKYEALLVKMILSVAEDGDSVVFSASDSKINREKVLAEAMKIGKIKLTEAKEKGAFDGGIVLRGKDCDKNLSLEVELETLRAEENLTAKKLFS